MCGVVEDGIIPGLYGYEAGQSAVGDIFEWYVEEALPAYVKASEEGIGVHQWLEREAVAYKPGQTGLLALDWWNGNRSVLVDTDLTGLMLGMTLLTKPQEIYRALLGRPHSARAKLWTLFTRTVSRWTSCMLAADCLKRTVS